MTDNENETTAGTEDEFEHSGVMFPQLQELEKRFFEIVDDGSVTEARLFLKQHPDFNINAINFQGVSALHIAVSDRNTAMVEYLLSHPDIDPGDTHLHAIRDNQVRIAVLILNKLNELTPGLEYAGVTHSPDFPDDTTPLAVAAQYGRFEMIDILRFRRHILQKPHPPSCNCDEVCKPEREKVDIVTLEKMRLFIYSAISNPIYLCQTEEDPILKAFQLSAELSKEASFDKEFYPDYKALSNEVSQFATELIDCARTAEEVRCILKQITGFGRTSSFEYPRLLLALDYEQKTFVAHPNVQQLVESKWIDTWHEWKVRNTLLKCLTIIPRIGMLPIMAFVILLAPNSKQAKFYEIPVNKCLSSIANYLIFLTFVFLQSQSDKIEQLRGPPNTGYEWVLAIYVISYTVAFVRLCIVDGPIRCFRTRTNWYELVMIILFILTFLFWIVSALDVRINGQRDLERKYWHKYDPTLIAEGIFCVATIMAFFKLLFICQLDYDLGPLQLSLVKMIRDVGHFVAIFGIIVMAFAIGLCHLYQYYNGMVQTDDESKLKTEQESSFVDLKSTLKTLFWAVFCMSPVESADVIIENLPGERDSETIINHHSFTEFIGYLAFASFQFISVVIVLNMLIACMANTFTKVTDNVNVEWIFGRTEAYVDFMLTTTLPPPFCIFSIFTGLRPVIEYIKILIKPPPGKRARWDFVNCCYIEDLEEKKDERFAQVMTQLVQRYLCRHEKKMEETDTQKLRKELKEFSNILKEALSPS
ncbi:Short transient receptor potential channel 5 [Trachymyrmex septentrionalis]|uniref:Short transient receptor potential channel 5 n=2 Tax=Trachymyrmex septentrionalis TaxID=34720 RepID=A0A195FGG7_9HYME|nr:PREDICTED: short transient receptor potential channel 4-like isoform X1 [Trachymyrmex septentrionalis]KYN39104.1 Short transient receptor potential channel 5 [Trachymyrmex septentrionalis]